MRRRVLPLLASLGIAAALALPRGAAAAPAAEPSHPDAQPHALPGAPVCGPSQASPTEPQNGRNDTGTRIPAPIYFAPDFPVFADTDVNTTLGAVGGFGGIRFRAPLHHTPVVFVHGNQADAQNWLDVMAQFQAKAGYTMQEMYALSYNGLANYYAGAPLQMAPSSLDQAYVEQNSSSLANGGHGGGNDDNVPDLCHFVEAVQWYTGSTQVDIVAHSLGVTITRRLMELYPALARDVTAFVAIAGANHGTSVCSGLASSYYGCDEIAPGTPWLDDLNHHPGETYGPTQWMTVYNGAEGDPFFGPGLEQSPALQGADNRQFNGTPLGPGVRGDYHNDLRVDPPEVETYLSFLLAKGQAGPGAASNTGTLAAGLASDASQLEAKNQQMPATYQLADAPLCIPGLTAPPAGCTLPAAAGGSGGGPSDGGLPPGQRGVVAGLPNTSSGDGAAGGAGIAVLALVVSGLGESRRWRRRARRAPTAR